MKWLLAWLDRRIDVAITNRIVTFHRALVERGQINPIPPKSVDTRRMEA